MAWMFAATVDEIEAGKMKIVCINGKEIGLFHESGDYFAVLNYCPHRGAPVCLGKVTGMVTSTGPGETDYDAERKILRCPWHHWEFDLESGNALTPIRQRLKTFPVTLESGNILVDV
jgi:nitrite reductase/ring-hydroxylating ferredoxin subunit